MARVMLGAAYFQSGAQSMLLADSSAHPGSQFHLVAR